ncbi:WD domain, G-beta repeat-containing protein [Besnoitia besnoiti]|uniref:WD domain, G-beta repeat-containing protein n=1 Tax=Besnoitia besnoiti TaxID=94643 RepID=A0A2A9MDM4_BESBE|nr:WD domain, G-beta repeat-containing protein [Besnoitia besnoiti]PFH33482.1 WD domain, G-beta repeat-containing protein [Besnoitia besnoiti]
MSSDEEEMRAIREARGFKTPAERRRADCGPRGSLRRRSGEDEGGAESGGEDTPGSGGVASRRRSPASDSEEDDSFGPKPRLPPSSASAARALQRARGDAQDDSDAGDDSFGPRPLASNSTSPRGTKQQGAGTQSPRGDEEESDDDCFGPKPAAASARKAHAATEDAAAEDTGENSPSESEASESEEPSPGAPAALPAFSLDDEDFLLGFAPEPSPASSPAQDAATDGGGAFHVRRAPAHGGRRSGKAAEEEEGDEGAEEDEEEGADAVDPEDEEAAAMRSAVGLPAAFGLAGAAKPAREKGIWRERASAGKRAAGAGGADACEPRVKREPNESDEDTQAQPHAARRRAQGRRREEEYRRASSSGRDTSEGEEKWRALGLPVALEVSVPAHSPSVATALGLNPKANRMVTGGSDGVVRFWDFQGMTNRMRSYRQVTPVEKHAVETLAFSARNDLVLVASGDAQCRIYSAQDPSQPMVTTTKGDMYVRDVAQTKGHTHKVLDCHFHPVEKHLFVSCGLDASVRLWDVNAPLYGMLQTLPHIACMKAVDRRGLNSSATHCASCMYTPTKGNAVVVGCADGSLQMWGNLGSRKSFGRPDAVVRDYLAPGAAGPRARAGPGPRGLGGAATGLQTWGNGDSGLQEAVLSLRGFQDDFRFVSRSGDGRLALWDLRKFKAPVCVVEGLSTSSHRAGVCLSPDETYICTTTQFGGVVKKEKPAGLPPGSSRASGPSLTEGGGSLEVFRASDLSPVASFPLEAGVQPLRVEWPKETNQILMTCSDGSLAIFFDRTLSQKGALLFVDTPAGRRRREEEEAGGSLMFAKEYIFVPGQLPEGYKETFDGQIIKVRPRGKERMRQFLETQKTSVPPRPAKEGYGGANVGGGNRSQHLLKQLGLLDPEKLQRDDEKDPVEALRAYAEKTQRAGAESQLISRAYATTQPKPVLNTDMEEDDDEDELLKQRERCPRCALRMCHCGYMEEMEKLGVAVNGDAGAAERKKQRTA